MRRTLAAIGAAAAAVVVLSACGAAGGTPQSQNGTQINVAYWPGPELDGMKAVADAYNNGQGKTDHVSVNLVTIARADMFNKELVEMSSKSSKFDMYYEASYLLDQHKPSLAPIDNPDTSAVVPSAVNGFSSEGKLYAVPLDASMVGTIYRHDLMKQLMDDPAHKAKFAQISQQVVGKELSPKDPAQWSWDDYLATAAYFTKKYNPDSPTQYGTILPGKNTAFAGLEWSGVLYSSGGSWADSSGRPAFDTPQALSAAELYANAVKLGVASPNSSQGDAVEVDAALTGGNAAFAMEWYSSMDALSDPAKSPVTGGKVTFAPIPGSHKGHMHLQGVGVNKYSQHQDAAQKFAAYLLTSKALQTYGEHGGMPPAPSFLDSGAKRPQLAQMKGFLQDNTVTEPGVNGLDAYTVATDIAASLSGAWNGTADPKSALAGLQAKVLKGK